MSSAAHAGWAHVELGEVAGFRNGINYNKQNFGKGIPVISVKDFWERSFPQYDSLEEINPNGVVRPEHALKDGDILLVRSNGNRELIGRSLFIRNLPARPVTHSAFTIRVRFTSRLADPRFFAYLFRSPIIRQVLSAQGNGANISNLNQDILTRLRVALPPLRAQQSIAAILSAYDDLIENNTRRIAILEEMARRIYEEWFVRFRFPGHKGMRMVESELGLVPEGWAIESVEDVTETLGGGTPSKTESDYWDGGDINWYSPTDLTGARTVFMEESASKITALGLAKSSAKLFPGNSVMMTSRATLGVIAVNTTPACTNQGFIVCVPSDRMPLWLLFHWLKANESEFEGLATGATFKEITKGVFRKINVAVPTGQTAAAFERVVAPMMDLVLRLERKNRNLRTTRDLLLPKLISGELDVSAMPEPAALAA